MSINKYVPQTYAYEFADVTAPMYMPEVSFPFGAAHTAEIQYIFPNYHGASGTTHPLNAEQSALSDTMVGYWTSFAHDGDPNGDHTPTWPAFVDGNAQNWQMLQLGAPETTTGTAFDTLHKCEFWASLE